MLCYLRSQVLLVIALSLSRCGNYARIIDFVYEESGHAAWVSEEDWRQFYRGSFTIKINNASHNYDEERISKMLEILANGIFPELHK